MGQEVGETTKQILENVSTNQKPQAVEIEKPDCKILGILNCLKPRVDYTHQDLLPQENQVEDSVGFWGKVGDFFSGLFTKSTDKQSGYGYTYLPQGTGLAEDIGTSSVNGISLQSDAESMHENIKKSNLPYDVYQKLGPTQTLIADNTNPEGTNPTSTASGGIFTEFQGLNYFSQSDPKWKDTKGPKYCDSAQTKIETIGNSGCGPTSVAMIASGKNSNLGPKEVWEDYVKAGKTYCATGLGDHAIFLTKYGFKTKGTSTCSNNSQCLDLMANYLNAVDKGTRVLILLANFQLDTSNACNWGGHFAVVTAVKGQEIFVYDPYYGYHKEVPISSSSIGYKCQKYRQFLIIDL